jgi:hypothetical protein
MNHFLDKFGVEHKDFEELMESWFIIEESIVKEGERYIVAKVPKGSIYTIEYNDLQALW